MAVEKRISELTPKGANLDNTDLFEVSVSDGLGGYDTFYITGAEILSVVPSTNIYNTDGTLTGNRTMTMAGNRLNLSGGQLNIESSSNIIFDGNTNLYFAKSGGSNGITISAAGGGGGVKGTWTYGWNDGEVQANGNLGGESIRMQSSATDNCIGYRNAINTINWYAGKFGDNFALKNDTTEIYNVNQVSKLLTFSQGVIRNTPLTTAQISAIASPLEGMQVYNGDRDRIETYDSSRSIFVGEAVTYAVQNTSSSPVSGGTNYFGAYPKGMVTTSDISKVYVQKAGVIRKVVINSYSGTAGTNENWSFYIRLNNTTDYLIETVGLATNERTFNNNTLNIPVVEGDYFEIKTVNPPWGTAPATTATAGNIIVE